MPLLPNDFEVEADRVGIIFPVHIWGLPNHVIRFINHLKVKPKTFLFALAVNAGQPAATLLQLKKLMSTRGLSLSLGYSIVLPSNYIPWGGPGQWIPSNVSSGKHEKKSRPLPQLSFTVSNTM
jgi:hypothetical protein